MRRFKYFEHSKSETLRIKKYVTNRNLKLKFKTLDFEAFQVNLQMPSHDKILLRIPFEAFDISHRNTSLHE